MNFVPKAGPLVAELLSGLAFLTIVYLERHGLSFEGLRELPSGANVALVLLAWILGTLFDAFRNQLEWLWDSGKVAKLLEWVWSFWGSRRFKTHTVYWDFFFHGDEKCLANLEHYYWSFYLLDSDMAIAIVLSISLSLFIKTTSVRWYVWLGWIVAALVFAIDARSLRIEMEGLLDAERK
jgi:hypothetical protein